MICFKTRYESEDIVNYAEQIVTVIMCDYGLPLSVTDLFVPQINGESDVNSEINPIRITLFDDQTEIDLTSDFGLSYYSELNCD